MCLCLFLSPQTRMQSLHPEPGARYRNVMDALRQIVRTEGVWRPIRGVNVLAVGAGPAHALYFACYEKIKFSLSDAIHPGANSHFANGEMPTNARTHRVKWKFYFSFMMLKFTITFVKYHNSDLLSRKWTERSKLKRELHLLVGEALTSSSLFSLFCRSGGLHGHSAARRHHEPSRR